MKITRIIGREIYDSASFPTIQCQIFLDDDSYVTSSVPSGTSVSSFEAIELRDGGKRLGGEGVLKAIENIEQIIAPNFIGKEPFALEMDQKMIDIDGTEGKSRLGANAMLAVSMAMYKAQAKMEQIELYELIAYIYGADSVSLPFPLLNVINGGAHANNNLRIQEFMIIPIGMSTFRAAFEAATIVYRELGVLLKLYKKNLAVGAEGGYACEFESDDQALDILFQAIQNVSSLHTVHFVIALDVAATQFYDPKSNLYMWKEQILTSDDLIEYYSKLVAKYPIYSIEDGLAESDITGWVKMTQKLGNKIQIVGDDIFATNMYRIAEGVQEEVATSVIIKPNQIGTVTESLEAIKLCRSLGLNTIVSHRSRDTEDTFIADLAVGTSAGQIKAGGCSRSERIAKYNRLLMIEDELTFAALTR